MLSSDDIQRLGNIPSAEFDKIQLAPGDDVDNSQWRNLINLRLEVQGNYLFWKTRGGSTVVNSFFGNILTVYAMEAQADGIITEYLAVHTTAGKVFLWNIDGQTSTEIVTGGFSTSEQIQFANIGRFIYMFDYDGGQAKYYDITDSLTSDFLSYDRAYLYSVNWLAEGLEEGNIWGFRKGEPIVVWPNQVPEAGNEIFNSATFTAGDAGTINPDVAPVNSFRYVYNGGKFLKDLDGAEYKETQFITFPAGASPFGFTVEGSGADFTIQQYYIPLSENGEPAFVSYRTKIDSVDGQFITYKDPTGVERSSRIGGLSAASLVDENLAMPYNPDVEELVGTPASKTLSPDGDTVIDNLAYTEPRMYRQYVVYDMLNDGSFTIPGKPFQLEATPTVIHVDGGTVANFSVTAPSANVEKRFLACTRWQPTAEKAFDPVSPEYPNSPLFITGEIDKNRTFIKNKSRDDKLFRGITEQQPMVAGVSDLFDTDSLKPNSVAQFTGSLMVAGYTLNRPIPAPYTDASIATDGNIFADLTATNQLPNNMALAFQFEYSDGRKSTIVETEEFLQEGSVIQETVAECEQSKGTASHQITSGVAYDGSITITYDGYTITLPLTQAAHSAPADLAEAIRQAIEGDATIRLNAAVPSGGTINYTEKRYGEEFNGNIIDFEQIAPWDIGGASFLRAESVNTQSADPDSIFFKPDGTIMYVLSRTGDEIDEYALGTAWDISTATYTDSLDVSTEDGDPDGIYITSDGLHLFLVGDATNLVYHYNIGTAWDISTATPSGDTLDVSNETTSENSLSFRDNGEVLYLLSQADARIYVYNLTTPFSLTTASYSGTSFDLSGQDASPDGIFFKDDGTKMWVVGDTNDTIYEYVLGTPWDITTATLDDSLLISAQDTTVDGIYISNDGLRLYHAGRDNDSVYQYDLPAGLGISFDTEDPTIANAAEPEPEPPTGYLVLAYNFVSVGDTENYKVFLDTFDSNTIAIKGGESRDVITDKVIAEFQGAGLTDYSFTKENLSLDGELVPAIVIKDTTANKDNIGVEFGSYPETTNDRNAEFEVGAPGEPFRTQGSGDAGSRPSEPGTIQDVGLVCTQAQASIDVDANGLGGGGTEDHTITVDGDSTAPITIADTDTLEGIVDKYVAEIQSTPAIDIKWKSEKVDNGDGTWRLLLTFREYGSKGDGRAVSVSGDTAVTLVVNSPSTGGSTAQNSIGSLEVTAGSDATTGLIVGLLFEAPVFTDDYYYTEISITENQTAEQVATELATALQGDTTITDNYTVTQDTTTITFTAVAQDKQYNGTVTQIDVNTVTSQEDQFVEAGEADNVTAFSPAVDLGRTAIDLGVPADVTFNHSSPTPATNRMEITYQESPNGVTDWTDIVTSVNDPGGEWNQTDPNDDFTETVNGVTISQPYWRVKVEIFCSNGYPAGCEGTGTITLEQTTGKDDNGITISAANITGGSTGLSPSNSQSTISANKIQIHSLNNLVSKVYILGRTVDPAKRFHLIEEFGITDAGAQGQVVELPNTEEALNEIQGDTFTEPTVAEIIETVDLPNFINVGTPFQQFQISTQEQIVDQSTIIKAMPVEFDIDKSTMRYRVMIFTDRNIQLGYLVDATAQISRSTPQRIFEGDFEIIFGGMVATSREGITEVLGNVIWTTNDTAYAWSKTGRPQPLFDVRRYGVSANNNLIDVIYSQDYNELWFIYRNNDIVVYDFDTQSSRRMRYTGVGTIRAGAFFDEKLYIAGDTELMLTDVQGVTTDQSGGDTVLGIAETIHLGNELMQNRLMEITIGGQKFYARVEVDLQPSRIEFSDIEWEDDFVEDVDVGAKKLEMYGTSFSINEVAVMPRIRIKVPAESGGRIAHVLMKYVPTQNLGKVRQ